MLGGHLRTLVALETSTDDFQSFKKSDEKQDDVFASEEAAQRALSKATDVDQKQRAKSAMLTSSIRRTLRYLYYLGGIFAPFRGILVMLVWNGIDHMFLKCVTSVVLRGEAKEITGYVKSITVLVLTALTSPIALAWTHHIVRYDLSRLRDRRQRMSSRVFLSGGMLSELRQLLLPHLPPMSAIKHNVVPTVMEGLIRELHRHIPQSLIYRWALKPLLEASTQSDISAHGGGLLPGLLAATFFVERICIWVLVLFLRAIARTLLIRVQASSLPDDVQSIIPFDRRFGVSPGARTGSRWPVPRHLQGITPLEAWQTLPWSVVWRCTKLRLKKMILVSALVIITSIFVASVQLLSPGYSFRTKTIQSPMSLEES